MRVLTAVCAVLLFAGAALGQVQVMRGYAGYSYGYGPYVPMVTTPQISLQTYSPSPVGASNATWGLTAGARNSTLSIVNGNTSSDYTVAVWYQGGDAPLVSSPEVSLTPRMVHEGRIRREGHREHVEAAPRAWTYYASAEEIASPTAAAATARAGKRASHTYTNQDVERQNDKNGQVKYDGKTEQIN
ncbi:MAG TPA: hypothetical protein VFB00_06375 [Terriglobales bacterium]|nr:hypothetical protein [Terriglobales bacterium]